MERYYPIKDLSGDNIKLYKQYLSQKNSNMFFIGRCGKYRYMDMDDTISESLKLCKELLS